MSTLDALAAAKDFTDAERKLAAYILTHADEVVHMRVAALAEQSHTSNATVARLCKKIGSAGYGDFRVDLSRDMERRRSSASRIDANAPILKNQGPPIIMSAIAALTRDAVNDCYATVPHESLERAAELIGNARRVIAYAVGDTFLTTEAFSNLIEKIGVTCLSAYHNGDVMTTTNLAQPDDVGLFVTYSGELVDHLAFQRSVLLQKRCKTILVTANESLRKRSIGFDCVIVVPSRETNDGREKVATFYSQTCLRYALECIYGIVFAQGYEQSRRHKNMAEYVPGGGAPKDANTSLMPPSEDRADTAAFGR